MILDPGTRIEELVSDERLDIFWEMVTWCSTKCFGLPSSDVTSYRESLADLPPDVAVLTYAEHPMNLAADLSSRAVVEPEFWLMFDVTFEATLIELREFRGSEKFSEQRPLPSAVGTSQQALEKLRDAEDSIEMASKTSSKRKTGLDAVVGGVVAVVSARMVIVLAELIALLSKFLR